MAVLKLQIVNKIYVLSFLSLAIHFAYKKTSIRHETGRSL